MASGFQVWASDFGWILVQMGQKTQVTPCVKVNICDRYTAATLNKNKSSRMLHAQKKVPDKFYFGKYTLLQSTS